MLERSRAGNTDRAINFDATKSLVIQLIKLDFIVGTNDDARNVLLASLSLVELEQAVATLRFIIRSIVMTMVVVVVELLRVMMILGIMVMLGIRIVIVLALVLVVFPSVRQIGNDRVSVIFVDGKLNVLRWRRNGS